MQETVIKKKQKPFLISKLIGSVTWLFFTETNTILINFSFVVVVFRDHRLHLKRPVIPLESTASANTTEDEKGKYIYNIIPVYMNTSQWFISFDIKYLACIGIRV